jgi:D-alanine-D-alanine ligase-like ATP-grasp enzyme
MDHTLSYCPDCGPATVPHWIERLSARIDVLFGYLTKPPELIWRGIKPGIARLRLGRMVPAITSFLAAIGLGKIVTKPDEKANWRTRVLWEEAVRRGIVMKEFRPFGISRELFFASYDHDTVAFDGLPRPRTARETSLNWMDDKGIIIEKFRAAGIPMPRGKTCTNLREADAAFKAVGGPVIVKPNLGSRSRHTYVHLVGLPSLHAAFLKAKELSPYVVVEEELIGFVFRITLIDGKIAGVMRREPPHVIGDGTNTVRKLVEKENKNPLRHGPIFHELSLGDEAIAELKKQHLSPDAIPKKGMMVLLHEKVSRAYGASTTEMTDVHPDNEILFLKIGTVLDDPLVGVDFMIEDISRSWREQKCGVIECNSLPFIDLHHFPLKGPVRNPAGAVWDMIFPTKA